MTYCKKSLRCRRLLTDCMLCNPFSLSSCSIHTSPPTNQNLLQGLYAISNWNIAKTLNHCPHWFRPLNRQRSPFKEASAESSPLWLTSVIKIPCERVCQITISLSLLFPIKTHKILLVLSVTSLLLFSRPLRLPLEFQVSPNRLWTVCMCGNMTTGTLSIYIRSTRLRTFTRNTKPPARWLPGYVLAFGFSTRRLLTERTILIV